MLPLSSPLKKDSSLGEIWQWEIRTLLRRSFKSEPLHPHMKHSPHKEGVSEEDQSLDSGYSRIAGHHKGYGVLLRVGEADGEIR